MPPVRRPHDSKSELERRVCEEMDSEGVPHEHRSLHFRVRLPSGEVAEYEPAIVARRGPLLFLLVPTEGNAGPPREREVLKHFLEQHSPEIVLVLVAPEALVEGLPPETYDEVYADTDLLRVARRIREQDPDGMVRPFVKPR